MKKNIVAAVMAAMLLVCLLMMAGCGGSEQTETPAPTVDQTQEAAPEESTTQQEATEESSTQEAPTQESLPISGDIVTLEEGTLILPDGHAIKPEYPINETSIGRAIKRFQYLHDSYLTGTDSNIYVAIIPDKGYYLQDTVPTLEYEQLFQMVQDGMPYASYVDLTDTLTLDAYYYTDIHWRQEYLWDAANRICQALGVTSPQPEQYTKSPLQLPFYGMYYEEGTAMGTDNIVLLENNMINGCTVTHHDTGRTTKVYDRTKMKSETLYDVYLSGATPLLTIENPQATTDRELIIFRDSFGSSLVPLLLQDYANITLVDIRYVASNVINRFVDFHGQDVLFLYSTHLINNSAAMK